MDCENSKEYTLSIRLMPDGFSFSIHNVNAENSFHFEKHFFGPTANYLAALEEGILQREELLQAYRQVHIIQASQRFTLVPSELYRDDLKQTLYAFNITPRREMILCDSLEQTGAFNLYGIDEEVYAFLCRTFTNPEFHHHLSILNEYFGVKSRLGNSDKMICQLRDGMLDLLCFSKGKLLLANTFSCRHPNDAAYYILNAWKSLHMDANADTLQFTGPSDEINELTTLLNPYIASITPVVFPAQMFNLGNESLDAPFDLIALPLCV